ncbi:MAG: formylmethanofuran dehydrogenase subunit C [Dongiaceae bacterium]
MLTLRDAPRQRIDLSPLIPDRLVALDARTIAGVELACGNRQIPLGDLFAVAPGDPADLRLVGDCGRCDRIGAGMTHGTITIDGHAGAYLGLQMRGGTIRVRGNAGIGTATEMHGGFVEIDGSAGDLLGSALPGAMRGMGGGLVVVRGGAADRIGDRMRRGTIVVEGGAGAYAGSRMIAGTVVVLGTTIGCYPGFGMKRGSLILRGHPERQLPTFSDCGHHDLGFLSLLWRSLRGRSRRLDELARGSNTVWRLAGDRAVGGKGEILLWQE